MGDTSNTKFIINAGLLNKYIINIAFSCLLIGFPLSVLAGMKLHYPLFLLLTALIAIINIRLHFSGLKFIYFFLLSLPIIYHIIQGGVNLPFIYSLLPYVIVPLFFFHISFSDYDPVSCLIVFEFFTVLNFIGVLLQAAGADLPFLAMDHLYLEDEIANRYGSFAGSTLALGLTASITCVGILFKWVYLKQRSLRQLVLLAMGLTTLILASSRRYYILLIIVGLLIFLLNAPKRINTKKFIINCIIVFSGLLIAIAFLYQIKDNYFFLQRFFSIIDFEQDGANVERLAKWLYAIDQFLQNFWLGLGLGETGTIGKDFDPTTDSITDFFSAESYYLKVFVETGFIFCLFYFVFHICLLVKAIKRIKESTFAFASYLIIFFFIESFMSTAIESPMPSMLFWLSSSSIVFYKKI